MFDAAEKQELLNAQSMLQKDVVLFIEKMLGEATLEKYQKDICGLVVEYDRLAIKACHAVGKTWLMGRVVLWFLNSFVGSVVITTAPTNRQVETLLWGEIRKAHRRSRVELGGKVTNKKISIDDDWYAMGFSPQAGANSDSGEQQGSSFQGFHARYVLIVFDEATGIPHDIYTMAEGLLTSGVIVKWICIANPTSTASEFFHICKKAEWKVVTINCFDSPNMIANGFVNRTALEIEIDYLKTLSDFDRLKRIKNYLKPSGHLLSAQWAVSKIFDWGFDHPLTKSKILGEFPNKGDDVVVKFESMQNAVNRDPIHQFSKRYMGVDVARFGDDLTVITEFGDTTFNAKYVTMKEDTSETAGRVVSAWMSGDMTKEIHVAIDCTGVGSGVYDALKEMKRLKQLPEHFYIHEIHFGMNINHENDEENKKLNDIYENLKCYMFDMLNKDLRDRLWMPPEEIYQEETVSILYKYSRRGKLVIEAKEDYKKRTKKSPDHSDSLALANFARYLKPTYGSFKGRDDSKSKKPFSSEFTKIKIASKIKVETY